MRLVTLLGVEPRTEHGAFPAKAAVGEIFPVSATVFTHGLDVVRAEVILRDAAGTREPAVRMTESATEPDRFVAHVTASKAGDCTFAVRAWIDPIATWRRRAGIKVEAGVDVELELEDGARLLERLAGSAGLTEVTARAGTVPGRDPVALATAGAALRDRTRAPAARMAAFDAAVPPTVLAAAPLRDAVTESEPLPLRVKRSRALVGAWYEFFPRSEGARENAGDGRPAVSGTLRTAAERLPGVAAMGFDVVYLPPVHPIGVTGRKGPDDTPSTDPADVGSPWAVGGPTGGHDAVHPDLGTLDDFDFFVAEAARHGLEVALDFALQCSPDHPWVTEHPEWFTRRADGTIAYAENPPKKYQDIYPLDFARDPAGIIAETVRILRFWIGHGIRVFRVDNPHTKPADFWDAVLAAIHRADPDVVFLAEAFTRPELLHTLAKIGFDQSYTYFTWRETKEELTEYLTELSGPSAPFLRPNFFVNTPDILPGHLQTGGRPAFELRAVLAATLSPSWGMYAGYELCENTPARPDSEDYARSEKYELRPRDWSAARTDPDSIIPLITRLNELRRNLPALRQLRNLRFLDTDDDHVLAYVKQGGQPKDSVVVVVNLDPEHIRKAAVGLDPEVFGIDPAETTLTVRDLLTGLTHQWYGYGFVRLDPAVRPAAVFTLADAGEEDA
ncbi:DUF3416 domain-containing protein [Streptomyces sp. KK5PA1]|uniref:Alpha-1,4-glucan:maltose-1-phosphate maltosyltransferase n=1 Tax=Actinacidiphila acididurans TaxID=2784346 RepID=A0ABS2TXF6_9ACTN|nr:alpha-1,4-glucan--maltose-1-phosphate maltosyltransferase [Actinacidiphila acididurans]MBM9507472.1 DUF3416 domain-containing protein [Actinacidiphila acididurans]